MKAAAPCSSTKTSQRVCECALQLSTSRLSYSSLRCARNAPLYVSFCILPRPCTDNVVGVWSQDVKIHLARDADEAENFRRGLVVHERGDREIVNQLLVRKDAERRFAFLLEQLERGGRRVLGETEIDPTASARVRQQLRRNVEALTASCAN